MSSDAPDDTETTSSKLWAKRLSNKLKPYNKNTTARVQAIDTRLVESESNDDEDSEDENENEYESYNIHQDNPIIGLYAIQVSDSDTAAGAYNHYCVLVQKIQTNPKFAMKTPCIVCGGDHRFDECGVLKDVDFLRAHYIRNCRSLCNEAQARAMKFTGKASAVPLKAYSDGLKKKDMKTNVNLIDYAKEDD